MGRAVLVALLFAALAAVPATAQASWLPHPADATWTYEWTDSVYNTTPTKEKVTVKEQNAKRSCSSGRRRDGEPPGRRRARR